MASNVHLRFSTAISFVLIFLSLAANVTHAQNSSDTHRAETPPTFLGFDVNEYPGDAAVLTLRKTFAFAGYWLNVPPGAKGNNWLGKRAEFVKNGFGFLVLFNGRLDRELTSLAHASEIAAMDGSSAIAAARREGFPNGTIIFLDQEEGGRLLPEQMAYVLEWIETVNVSGFHAGIYCSGIPSKEGKSTVVTANDIREHQGGRSVAYFIYNDACPPSPGCAYPGNPPSPAISGIPFAAVWQFAQSPRRREFTKRCSVTYNADGNCYPPPNAGTVLSKQSEGIYLDLDSATSSDPSNGR